MRMTEREWVDISRILRTSPDAVQLREYRELSDGMQMSFAELQEMPLRLYGGVGYFLNANGPDLYTFHPIDFHSSESIKWPWCFCLLSARGYRLFRTNVNVDTGRVEITSEVVKQHFVERKPSQEINLLPDFPTASTTPRPPLLDPSESLLPKVLPRCASYRTGARGTRSPARRRYLSASRAIP